MKTRHWAILLIATALVCAALWAYMSTRQPASSIAEVYSYGELVYRIDVADPDQWGAYPVTHGDAVNMVVADEEGICVLSASCPDGLCVNQGYLSNAPIICLPNRVVVKWSENTLWTR